MFDIVTIAINDVCNEMCRPCFAPLKGGQRSVEEVLSMVDRFSSSRSINIQGGEPTLHRGLVDILLGIKQRGKSAHIATNGTYIPTRLLELSSELSENVQIQVGLFASYRELYEQITGRDWFERVIQNIKAYKTHYPTMLSSAIYRENFHDVDGLVRLADSLGMPIRINLTMAAGRGKNVELITIDEIERLKTQIRVYQLSGIHADAPFLDNNYCPAVMAAYGLPGVRKCPAYEGQRLYVGLKTIIACEFLQR